MRKILKGQKALITGANSGIGKAVAIALCRAGADVLINYRSGDDAALAVAEEATHCGCKTNGKAIIHQADVSDEEQVAPYRIRVNSVCPGAIRTPINKEAWETKEAYNGLLKLIPYKRIGEPEDIARTVVWLASDEADYITGANFYVDGGMTLYPGFESGG